MEDVPAHLFDETEPKVTVHHFEWGTSTPGSLVKTVLGLFAVLAVFLLVLVGVWAFLFVGFALGIVAAIRSLLFPTGRRG